MHNLVKNCCTCGRQHSVEIDQIVTGKGALNSLPDILKRYGAKTPFLLADCNTFEAAGERVCTILDKQGIAHSKYIFQNVNLEPDEYAVGTAIMHFDNNCDLIIGIGSGVINDIGKILSNTSGKKYIIVATAPSMDGYASSTSSMSMDGLKVSLNSRCADVIIGDTDILKNAPMHMLQAGLGDMLAKYVSIAEWRIAHIITGEYYCEQVAGLIRKALQKCVDNAAGLLRREEQAVEAVFEGLVIGGIAMAYAGVSRPASGVEHYFSHIWDMRGLALGTPVDLHGIQCAVATAQAIRLYEALEKITPNYDVAKTYVDSFLLMEWQEQLRTFLGKGAEAMIAQEKREGKYCKDTHLGRFARIADNWEEILQILRQELPSYGKIVEILNCIGISADLHDLAIDSQTAKLTFKATKDIRDKYVLSRLAWDMGVLDDLCELL